MDFYQIPFELHENSTSLIQPRTLLQQKNLLSQENLEKTIQTLNGTNIGDYTHLKGLAAEIIGRDLLQYSLEKENFGFVEGKFIEGNKDFVINSSKNYVAKLKAQNQVIILKPEENKDKTDDDNSKFGYKNIAEIDGLYLFKKKYHHKKNKKKLMVVEIKSGEIHITPEHVISDICKPLQEMYGIPVAYFLIGFKENLYQNCESNILNNYLVKFSDQIMEPTQTHSRFRRCASYRYSGAHYCSGAYGQRSFMAAFFGHWFSTGTIIHRHRTAIIEGTRPVRHTGRR